MIRLATSHAAITAPLVASAAAFPGIPIGRSLLDERPFSLSPVLVDTRALPSTNSLGLGGLGSGKSTTGKVRIRREINENEHQAVVIDSFGEDNVTGEWAPLVHDLGGRVVEAGSFTLNPVSDLFSPQVREQLVRSLILASEPTALDTRATHALQHALNHPKATHLNGLVQALVEPEDGRWPARRLAEWGEKTAMALSRYTEGSLRGIFDGLDSSLPPTDLPILSFDFTTLDRNSPAIPSLMAAVACWVEQIWLPQSTAVHRHLVLEEAWQILLSPATAELIQRLLKNSRKAALELNVLMHTLSDLGDSHAKDLARLCEIAHVGRLGPEEAAIVGAILGMPQVFIDRIPSLGPGQAVWKIGPGHFDIVQTVIDEDDARLTDTGTRRRAAQQAHADRQAAAFGIDAEGDVQIEHVNQEDQEDQDGQEDSLARLPEQTTQEPVYDAEIVADGWDDWELPPNVIDVDLPGDAMIPHARDPRHELAVKAAREGRFSEAAGLAAIGEREDINTHGFMSAQVADWMSTRAEIAYLSGDRAQAMQLRANVIRMGQEPSTPWFEQTDKTTEPDWHTVPGPSHPDPDAHDERETQRPAPRRRAWPYVAAIAALGIISAVVWQTASDDQEQQARETKTAEYKGRATAALDIDGVKADVVGRWSSDKKRVILELRSYFDANARYLRIDADGKTASSTRADGRYPRDPEIELAVADPLEDVTVRIAVGGRKWKEGSRAQSMTVRLSPTGAAFDGDSGKRLPSNL
ncbi:hypothetical protein [Streptomyces sp. NPDC059639]|uniref:hypothetical protein n=1 Tax=Streptomyces sp. NPDC059639 TaxID=3346891 RepID=UPI003675B8D8